MAKAEQTRETKRKFALWIRESSLDMAKQLYKEDNCASQSEFIEKAILFYAGYLLSGKSNRYLPNIITSTLKGIVDESDNRMSRMPTTSPPARGRSASVPTAFLPMTASRLS